MSLNDAARNMNMGANALGGGEIRALEAGSAIDTSLSKLRGVYNSLNELNGTVAGLAESWQERVVGGFGGAADFADIARRYFSAAAGTGSTTAETQAQSLASNAGELGEKARNASLTDMSARYQNYASQLGKLIGDIKFDMQLLAPQKDAATELARQIGAARRDAEQAAG